MLLWLSSVCWVIKLNTLKWDILATGVAVYFESKLRKLKLQTYQSISPAKVREKSPSEVENRIRQYSTSVLSGWKLFLLISLGKLAATSSKSCRSCVWSSSAKGNLHGTRHYVESAEGVSLGAFHSTKNSGNSG